MNINQPIDPGVGANMAQVHRIFQKLKGELQKVIVGQVEVVNSILVALLTGGHVLLEGVPGTGKTLLCKTLSYAIKAQFKRIQLTPDLLPSDIVGTSVFDDKTKEFRIEKGPIFSNIVLADEINRAPAKTQSALLEAMEENQVTIEGNTFKLPEFFMVFATQNPLEFEGTYPLPEAQLDRFLMKIVVPYPAVEEENQILQNYEAGFRAKHFEDVGLEKVASLNDILECRKVVGRVTTQKSLIGYINSIVRKTRDVPTISVGAGPRAGIALLLTSKALALISGREYVIPDDIKQMVQPVLRHRIILSPESEIEGHSPDTALMSIVEEIRVPR